MAVSIREHAILCLIALFTGSFCVGPLAYAQLDELPEGFQRIRGKYIDIITDIPIDENLRELPAVFDAAVPQWCKLFGMHLKDVADWHVDAHLMKFRERFRNAGMIPENLPDFPYGFQFGNKVWVMEQPSGYYRRHLLLHEGTHWFMNRKYGNHGPPWLMEGMAEWLGTHRWNGSELSMGIIPASRDEVPYWGRTHLIQQQLADGIAPSLEDILRYSNTAHQQVDAYAWSWAAVLFLRHHPATSKAFEQLLKQPMSSDSTVTRWLFTRLKSEWPQIRTEWNAMVTELDYGFDPQRGFLEFQQDAKQITAAEEKFNLAVDRTWQSTGILVNAGDKIVIKAQGKFTVGDTPKPWPSTAGGVTLEYYRGEPLGKLLVTIAHPIATEPEFTQPLESTAVGEHLKITVKNAGELHFRINEANSGLADNSGEISIAISRTPVP